MMIKQTIIFVLTVGLCLCFFIFHDRWQVSNQVVIEFHIHQNMDHILFSRYGEPAQCAIWLENPTTRQCRTVFVTYRSAAGDWEGKLECPLSLPRWFEVFQQETGHTNLPQPYAPAPAAVTRATPLAEQYDCAIEVVANSQWICWIEVNMAADFNESFPELDQANSFIDTDQTGQPSLLYRASIIAHSDLEVIPILYGFVPPENSRNVQHDLTPITNAHEIFHSIKIRVVPSKTRRFLSPYLPGWYLRAI